MITFFGATTTATADPFGVEPGAPGYVSDGADHWFCFSATIPDQVPYNDAMENLDWSTDMYDVPTPSCGPATDIVFWRNDSLSYGGFLVRGEALCTTWLIFAFCDQFAVTINYAAIQADTIAAGGDLLNLVINLHKTIRHEIGHTPGLSHDPAVVDAMRSGWVPSDWAFLGYNQHHIDHVNGFY
jgi:hypothetical protein